MSADPPHDTPDHGQRLVDQREEPPKHRFTQALETWEAWSAADTWQRVIADPRQHGRDLSGLGDLEKLASGPDPLEALRANRELVDTLTGWQWQAMRAARQQGRGWHEIAAALGLETDRTDLPAALACGADVARRAYLGAIQRQQRASNHLPPGLLRYDPRWRELADDNPADRAHQHGRAETGRESGHER